MDRRGRPSHGHILLMPFRGVLIWDWMIEEELIVRLTLFLLNLFVFTFTAHVSYIMHPREPGAGLHLGLVPFAASLHGHDAQRRRRDLDQQLREHLVSEAVDAYRDAVTPSAARPPPAPRVDHDDGHIPHPSSCGRAICYCAQRSRARVYVSS